MTRTSVPAVELRLPRWRARLLLGLLLTAFAALIGRAVWLQGVHDDFLQERGEERFKRTIEIPADRGVITDRDGAPLAISTPVESVWVRPDDFRPTSAQMQTLAKLLAMDGTAIERRIAENAKRDFVFVRRQLPPDLASRVAELRIPGVFLQREFRRFYPAGELTAHLVGFTDVDERGQEGIELAFEETLAGRNGSRRVIRDRRGRIVEDAGSLRAPQRGRDVALSIDSRIQYRVYSELRNAMATHRAKGASAVVLDVRTGEVLALVNLPAYNPNNRGRLSGEQLRNRAITDLYEPGSTMKSFTIAAALESGFVRPDTVIQTAPGSMTIGSHTIRDVQVHGPLTVTQVLQKSSNVGSARIALAMPPAKLWQSFRDAGFGTPTRIGFPGEAQGRLRAPETWQRIEQATMSYGHGLSVTLLQIARAYTIFATDGELRPLSLTRVDAPVAGEPVISAQTAATVRRILELATQVGGTAPLAQVPGYRVGGKTGTARKLENGRYTTRYVASFIGLAPVSNPRLVIAVVVDEPSAGVFYGGRVAAPVFSGIASHALRLLGVAPDAPLDNVVLPAPGAEVREQV